MTGPFLALLLGAAPPVVAELVAPVDEGTTVQRFLASQPRRATLIVHGCGRDLAAQLDGRSAPGILELDVTSIGDGGWYLVAALDGPDQHLDVSVAGGVLRIQAVRSLEDPAATTIPPASLDDLLAGRVVPVVVPPPALPLRFLHGPAQAPGLDPLTWIPVGTGVAYPEPATWEQVDALRARLDEPLEPGQRARILLALGDAHLALGFAREARYYLGLVAETPGDLPPATVALARARVELATGNWDGARASLVEARAANAPETSIAEALALVSLATGTPPRIPLGRLLLEISDQPETHLLAVELLQRGGDYADSARVLEAIIPALDPRLQGAAALRLADARIAAGDHAGARRALQGQEGGVAEVRRKLLDLLELEPREWPAHLAEIAALSTSRDRSALEALWLLVQVKTTFDEVPGAMADLQRMLHLDRETFERSEADELLWALYLRRLEGLEAEGRTVELVALHEETWSRSLLEVVDDPAPLVQVAAAYEALGLPDPARNVLRDAFFILSRKDADDPSLVLRLARLYVEGARLDEARATLRYLDRRPLTAGWRAEKDLLEAHILEAQGDPDGAREALVRATRHPETRSRAALDLAVQDAEGGRCAAAIPVLEQLLGQEPAPETPRPWLALARCLRESGDGAGAARVARAAAGRSTAGEDSRFPVYLVASGNPDSSDLDVEALSAGGDIWAALGEEDARHERFRAEIDALRQR